MADSRDKPELETLSYKPECPDCETPGYCGRIEQSNLKIIEAIECLISQVNDRLGELKASTFIVDSNSNNIFRGPKLISQALEEIDLFQKTTLFELRKALE